MQSREKLWSSYRQKINNNLNLSQCDLHNNQEWKKISEKLKASNLDYIEDNWSHEIKDNLKFLPIKKENYCNLANHFTLLQQIEDEFLDKPAIQIVDFNFSSHQLDQMLTAIQNKKMSKRQHPLFNSKELTFDLKKSKKIFLKKQNDDMQLKINVAIDGPSGSGKSTVAKIIGERFGLKYINTGLVYRAIAYNALKLKISLHDENSLIDSIKNLDLILQSDQRVLIGKKDVTLQLRDNLISQSASKIATLVKVREAATLIQKSYAQKAGTIMEGRDTTFKIMPGAEVKIFLDTSPEERAKRRVKQNKELGFEANYQQILQEIRERDERDRNRKIDPLHKTKDAILIDASNMNIEQVVAEISKLIKKKMLI